ncbi:MAG: Na+/H+ antiporter NhaA [Candidatus Rokubacteria bacterium]|nr:Na+/H+ antiporter NhaA [Candidatus Rokubacteria bacterium]
MLDAPDPAARPSSRLPAPPESWEPARRLAESLIRPIEAFLHIQAASGIALLLAAVAALVWANSPWGHLYERLWEAPVTIGVGGFTFAHSIRFWINDGLMVVFFFVVGLEIRREIHDGELSEPKRAALPVVAAFGGMVIPALIYLLLNPERPARDGWGVPMATDIAFAVGVLALLGRRVPAAIRVLLLAVAIIDDIGAIVVIALFYSTGIVWTGLALAGGGIAIVIVLQRTGVRPPLAYVPAGAIIWAGMLWGGVHPTIAGVLLGLLTPVRPWFGPHGFLGQHARELIEPLADLGQARREALSPVVRIEAALHPWVAFGVMPLFALANAGVNVRDVHLEMPGSTPLLVGIVAGLVIGKPVGILLASAVATRLGLAAVPPGVTWAGITLVGCVAGIGFTMAIFVAGLAFPDAGRLGVATLGVLAASAVAAVVGLVVGGVLLRHTDR